MRQMRKRAAMGRWLVATSGRKSSAAWWRRRTVCGRDQPVRRPVPREGPQESPLALKHLSQQDTVVPEFPPL